MRRFLLIPAALAAAGCGYVGEPQPPLANIPARVADLTVVQHGSRLIAQFTLPQLTTEGTAVKTPLDLDLRVGPVVQPFNTDQWAEAARQIPQQQVERGTGRYEIPLAEWVGKEVAVGVRSSGPNRKLSGWSNLVGLQVVSPPETPANLQAEPAPDGVKLTWQAQGTLFRVFRRAGDAPYAPLMDVAQSPWTDTTAQFGESYSYEVETIVKVGDNREAESDLSMEARVTPEDKFAPAVPAGLRAAGAPSSIELSWEANTEADFASYRIYRAGPGEILQQIGEATVPAYSDHTAERDKTYRYAVSSIDRVGNESARSAPVEARFP